MEHIPSEILFEILTYFSHRELIDLRSVSTLWKNIIMRYKMIFNKMVIPDDLFRNGKLIMKSKHLSNLHKCGKVFNDDVIQLLAKEFISLNNFSGLNFCVQIGYNIHCNDLKQLSLDCDCKDLRISEYSMEILQCIHPKYLMDTDVVDIVFEKYLDTDIKSLIIDNDTYIKSLLYGIDIDKWLTTDYYRKIIDYSCNNHNVMVTMIENILRKRLINCLEYISENIKLPDSVRETSYICYHYDMIEMAYRCVKIDWRSSIAEIILNLESDEIESVIIDLSDRYPQFRNALLETHNRIIGSIIYVADDFEYNDLLHQIILKIHDKYLSIPLFDNRNNYHFTNSKILELMVRQGLIKPEEITLSFYWYSKFSIDMPISDFKKLIEMGFTVNTDHLESYICKGTILLPGYELLADVAKYRHEYLDYYKEFILTRVTSTVSYRTSAFGKYNAPNYMHLEWFLKNAPKLVNLNEIALKMYEEKNLDHLIEFMIKYNLKPDFDGFDDEIYHENNSEIRRKILRFIKYLKNNGINIPPIKRVQIGSEWVKLWYEIQVREIMKD